jgi:hypothetical protein
MKGWLALALAATVVAGGARTALAAPEAVPDPRECIVEDRIIASVGDALGAPGGFGTNGVINPGINLAAGFEVTVRSTGGSAVPNCPVVLDFTGTNIRLFDPGPPTHTYTPFSSTYPITVVCSTRLRATSDINGRVVFQCRFGGFVNNNAPVRITVSACGVTLRSDVTCTSTDLVTADNNSVVNASDLNSFRQNLFAAIQSPETDYTLSGVTDSADLNIFRKDLFSPQNTGGSYCPL